VNTTDAGYWWDLAACHTENAELFFPVTELGPARLQVAQAKAVCARCRVRQECLEYAMRTRPVQGIWGGLTEAERERLRIDAAQHARRRQTHPGGRPDVCWRSCG
jgi:WhiB family transcriptional regulator, redox-sensing transcriptional regulator